MEDKIYLVGGDGRDGDSRVSEYNPRTNTWRNMPSLQKERKGHRVCTMDNKIFVLGGCNYFGGTNCEILDLSDDDPHWRYIADYPGHPGGDAMVIEKNVYILCYDKSVEVYDVDQGI